MPDFRIQLAGQLDDRCRAAFGGLEVLPGPSSTWLRGDLDQAGLHGVLERARVLGLEVLAVRRVRRVRRVRSPRPA